MPPRPRASSARARAPPRRSRRPGAAAPGAAAPVALAAVLLACAAAATATAAAKAVGNARGANILTANNNDKNNNNNNNAGGVNILTDRKSYVAPLLDRKTCARLANERTPHKGQEGHDDELARYISAAWADGGVLGAARLAEATGRTCGAESDPGSHNRGHWLGASLFLLHPLSDSDPALAAVDMMRASGTRHLHGYSHGLLKGAYLAAVMSGKDAGSYVSSMLADEAVADARERSRRLDGTNVTGGTSFPAPEAARAAAAAALPAARARLHAARSALDAASYASLESWLSAVVAGQMCRALGIILVDIIEEDFAKGGPLSYELEAVEPYRIESALESMRAEAWGNCLHAAGHLAWWASMQPDAPWRAHEQLSLVQEEEEGASSGEFPTRPRAQAYATCAAISAWPPPNDAIARARARDTPHTRARAGNASALPCGDAMTAAAGVSFCLHGAFHQAQMTSAPWPEPNTPTLSGELYTRVVAQLNDRTAGLPRVAVRAEELLRDVPPPPAACMSPLARRTVSWGCFERWFGSHSNKVPSPGEVLQSRHAGSLGMAFAKTRRHTYDRTYSDATYGLWLWEALTPRDRLETYLPAAAECAQLAALPAARDSHAVRMGCYIGAGFEQTKCGAGFVGAAETVARKYHGQVYGGLPCELRHQGMAPFIAAMLAAEQAAVSAASRGAAPDFASVSVLWPGVSSNTNNASHAHAQTHARAGAAPDADYFAELRALSAASVAAGGRDHYHLALRSIVYGAVARFMKYRKCPDATTQLCAPLRSAAISAAVLGARTASEAAALCESITRRAVRYDPEAMEMGTIGGVPAELKATCGW